MLVFLIFILSTNIRTLAYLYVASGTIHLPPLTPASTFTSIAMSLNNTPFTNPLVKNGLADLEKIFASSSFMSAKVYELERRSIFSRQWLLVSHKSRFREAGRWVQVDIAGYPILIVRDRTGNINGFHNVCRHRAYNVVDGDQGKASILACRYHGWSYGLNGKLAKAPGYQELSEFKKEQNGLFPVHVKLDSKGFVWVNLDGNEVPEAAWTDTSKDDEWTSQSLPDFGSLEYDQSQTVDVECNWKLAMVSHDGILESADAESSVTSSLKFPNAYLFVP